MNLNTHGSDLIQYFSPCLELLGPNEFTCAKLLYLVADEYYTHPAASGSHHNGLQSKEHGLIYHVWEGFWNLNQLIRARQDIIARFNSYEEFSKDEKCEHALLTAYFLHDILKFKSHPSGSNYTHDEDCYQFLKRLNLFSTPVIEILRYTHGNWSTALVNESDKFAKINSHPYADLIWLSHYADMTASRLQDIKIIESDKDKDFNKSVFLKRRKYKNKSGIDIKWWDSISADDIKSIILKGDENG